MVAIDATLHPISDVGFGFNRKGQFEISRSFSKLVTGYIGFCYGCSFEGRFLL